MVVGGGWRRERCGGPRRSGYGRRLRPPRTPPPLPADVALLGGGAHRPGRGGARGSGGGSGVGPPPPPRACPPRARPRHATRPCRQAEEQSTPTIRPFEFLDPTTRRAAPSDSAPNSPAPLPPPFPGTRALVQQNRGLSPRPPSHPRVNRATAPPPACAAAARRASPSAGGPPWRRRQRRRQWPPPGAAARRRRRDPSRTPPWRCHPPCQCQ